ncbi:membrane protein US18 [Mandrillus leucophaeus cytomegalovirus]|uniref:Membrane protein US18 n=1 Tax=Mandrillus leucophaeus cytomegalovirus TaxID=1654930 RepID=A0A0G2ULW4_9BETA|nr:membrane protein US18 [Mandrillus leucophaeus cytomegalovirus]AKI29722.1 membrane protein US18 [Mandrillus leucophaeus cytomegalovirus]
MNARDDAEAELTESWVHQNLVEWIERFRSVVAIYSNALFELAGTFSVCVLFWFAYPTVTEKCLACVVPTASILLPTLCLAIACCCQKELLRYSGSSTIACVVVDTGITVMTGFCCHRANLGLGFALTILAVIMCNTVTFYAGRNAMRWRIFFSGYGWCLLCFFFFITFAKAAIIYKIVTVMYFFLVSGMAYLMIHQLLQTIHPSTSDILTDAAELARSLALYTAVIALFNAFCIMFSVNQWMGEMINAMNQTEVSPWSWLLHNKP